MEKEETYKEMKARHERESRRDMRVIQIVAGVLLFVLFVVLPLAAVGCQTYECSDTCVALGGRCYDALPHVVCEMPAGDRLLLERVLEVRHDGTVRFDEGGEP